MSRLFPQASRLFLVGVAVFRRNGLFAVGSQNLLSYTSPLYLILILRIRYVLKIKDTDEVLFVVVFSLLHREDVEKEEADTKVKSQETAGARHEGEKDFEPEADDLD